MSLESYESFEQLSIAASELVISYASEAIKTRGIFRVALAGGSTPKRLYEMLSSKKYINRTDWASWKIYFGDERLVPLTDSRSNYNMIADALLKHVPIKENNVCIPSVSLSDPEEIASTYEAMIRSASTDLPRLDLVLLGLGSDGHTASLFPGKSSLGEQTRIIVATSPGVLPPHVDRVTFTLPFINAARRVVFLVSGSDKARAFRASYNGSPSSQIPASQVRPHHGEALWLVTQEVASP